MHSFNEFEAEAERSQHQNAAVQSWSQVSMSQVNTTVAVKQHTFTKVEPIKNHADMLLWGCDMSIITSVTQSYSWLFPVVNSLQFLADAFFFPPFAFLYTHLALCPIEFLHSTAIKQIRYSVYSVICFSISKDKPHKSWAMGLVYWINPYHGLCSTDWYIIHQFSHRLQASAGTSRQGLWWSATTRLGEEMSRGGWVSPKLFAPNVTPTSSKLPIILGKLTWHVSRDTLISEKTIWIFLFLGGWPIVGPSHHVDIFWDDSDIKSHSSHPCIYIYILCVYIYTVKRSTLVEIPLHHLQNARDLSHKQPRW